MEVSRKKSVLITARLNGAGGVETHLLKLCNALIKEEATVTLVCRVAAPSTPLRRIEGSSDLRIITTPFAGNLRWFRLSTVWALVFWPLYLARQRFDVLYTFELSGFTKFLKLFLRKGAFVIFSRAGGLLQPGESLDGAEKMISGFLVETPLQVEAARGKCGDVPIAAIPLLGHYSSPTYRTNSKPSGTLRVSFLGRYDANKGVHRLLTIWEELDLPDSELHFYGDGPDRLKLQRDILRSGRDKTVIVHGGWTTEAELAQILDHTDLLVLPSETEGLPIVLLEAMAYGVPFVATDVGAIRTLAENNPDVRVVANNNHAISEAIELMVKAIRSGMVRGDRLQAYHRERYSFGLLSRQWVNALLSPERFWATPDNVNKSLNTRDLPVGHAESKELRQIEPEAL